MKKIHDCSFFDVVPKMSFWKKNLKIFRTNIMHGFKKFEHCELFKCLMLKQIMINSNAIFLVIYMIISCVYLIFPFIRNNFFFPPCDNIEITPQKIKTFLYLLLIQMIIIIILSHSHFPNHNGPCYKLGIITTPLVSRGALFRLFCNV